MSVPAPTAPRTQNGGRFGMDGDDSAPVVVADDLTVGYTRRPGACPAVDGVTLQVPAGGILGVVGEAGSGKSTLAAAIAGRLRRGSAPGPVIVGGSLKVLGHQVRDAGRRTRDLLGLEVGYLPQDAEAVLTPHLTIAENVAEPIYDRDRRFDRLEAGGHVAALIDAVRLPLTVLERFPHELSRGQRQRVALAKALVLEPRLLVADEPTMGVDVLVRGRILGVLADLQRERNFSAVVVGHDLRELRYITDRVAVMHAGAIVGLGQMERVLAEPTHEYVEALSSLYPRHARLP
ncbi:ATP-binding cassette domain-containing protein [Schumannella sp. 10F1B-5-1]|uniref:ATP-binding cassette domain-containing protein n=1 Tax=Schumannella sp. 10F1B-5-1 TaxID=2590780 RepID=UPI0021070269|nr:dipeptide/oligopeptide/nickel ABC transporter ATP-binding protein [Schumannella sp. 10F1B-5-1]